MSTEEDSIKLAVMANDMAYLKKGIDKLDAKLSDNYITKEEFYPIKRVVYGLVGLIVTTVAIAILSGVIIK